MWSGWNSAARTTLLTRISRDSTYANDASKNVSFPRVEISELSREFRWMLNRSCEKGLRFAWATSPELQEKNSCFAYGVYATLKREVWDQIGWILKTTAVSGWFLMVPRCCIHPKRHICRRRNHNLSLCKFCQANLSCHIFCSPTVLHANSFSTRAEITAIVCLYLLRKRERRRRTWRILFILL